MAVANASWPARNSVPNISQVRLPSSSSCNLSLRFILGCTNAPKSLPIHHHIRNNDYRNLSPCRCSSSNCNYDQPTNNTSSSSSADWDWNRWTRHFSEIEQAERFASLLQFQLEEAIEKEDFQEASKLKTAMAEAMSKDSIAEILSELQNAIREERYHDASNLCRNTGSGLVGWWVGYSKDSDDPFGRLVQIAPGVGRFIGRSYSPRQLVSASPGTPLFEIFVVKDTDKTYIMQVAFMQRAKASNEKSAAPSSSLPAKGPSIPEVENASAIDMKVNEDKPGQNEEKGINFEGSTEEGIRSVINFLKDKIPELKIKDLKLLNVDVDEVMVEDDDIVNQLMEEDNEQTTSGEDSEDEIGDLDDPQPDRAAVGAGNDTTDDEKNLAMKLLVGGILHIKDDTPLKDEFVRVPAEIEEMERDSFVLHVPVKNDDRGTEKSTAAKVKIAAIAAQGVSELMPPDVAEALFSSAKISPKVSRNVREIVNLAVSQAKKQEIFSEYTNFSRVTTSRGDLDPFDGLYVGAFGPYGTEVVQLRRKYGNWSGTNDPEFFEYVEAVKVTGDLNVPAGQVTFRAKIAKGSRISNPTMLPDGLGVFASYKGQGRIAEFGFKNPKWVEGELLQFDGKNFTWGLGPFGIHKGADLGFLFVVPEQSFLVLFNRLRLPE